MGSMEMSMRPSLLPLHTWHLTVIAAFLASTCAFGQGFQDLDFESASLSPVPGDPYGRVQFDDAFGGAWVGFVGGIQQTVALYDGWFLDSSGIGIIDSGVQFGAPPIEGAFTAILQAGLGLGTSQPADTSLAQTGLIPGGTKSLQFKAQFWSSIAGDPFQVSVKLNGQTLSLTPLLVSSQYTLYAADVHAWAGQQAELSFTVHADNPHDSENTLYLDSIDFSAQAVPEPRIALFWIAAWLVAHIRRENAFSKLMR